MVRHRTRGDTTTEDALGTDGVQKVKYSVNKAIGASLTDIDPDGSFQATHSGQFSRACLAGGMTSSQLEYKAEKIVAATYVVPRARTRAESEGAKPRRCHQPSQLSRSQGVGGASSRASTREADRRQALLACTRAQ